MKTLRLVAVLICALFCFCASAQDYSSYNTMRDKGITLYTVDENYAKAKEMFQSALALSTKPANHDLNTWIKKCDDMLRQSSTTAQPSTSTTSSSASTSTSTTTQKFVAPSSGGWFSLLKAAVNFNSTIKDDYSVYKGQRSNTTNICAMIQSNNVVYVGEFDQNLNLTGDGVMVRVDGFYIGSAPSCKYYSGYFRNAKLQGKGTAYRENGNLLYYGDFSSDKPTGSYPNHSDWTHYKFAVLSVKYKTYSGFYIGETKNGLAEGKGFIVYHDGDIFYGVWNKGKYSSSGIFFYANGKVESGSVSDLTIGTSTRDTDDNGSGGFGDALEYLLEEYYGL